MKDLSGKKSFLHIALFTFLFTGTLLLANIFIIYTILIPQTPNAAVSYKTVMIDPGHGGIDTGTFYNNIFEKNINLQVALILKDKLISNGYNVIMTRETDISLDKLNKSSLSRHKRDLYQRVSSINNSNAEIFISIHVNSMPNSKAKGPLVFYNKKSSQSQTLASAIQNSLNKINFNDYTVLPRKEQAAQFYILNSRIKPGAIVELGFITSDIDKALLIDREYQAYIAEKIFEGIERYYGQN